MMDDGGRHIDIDITFMKGGKRERVLDLGAKE